ncbi:DUF3597 domain-containing protein [Roseisolibacter agri]|uniref:DUF3597 domain-containing protein n=1 Tax=Roseisolibacter agri TaxID=2014610 RepID=A0AA37Q755_9BACT|nr:DUF3597 domain-containing protein [Roseisolibacter agri]GLC27799.1 hypothetical protein rosag_43120 [Roseisolibacter agri]
MSIFGKLWDRLRGHANEAKAAPLPPASLPPIPAPGAAPAPAPAPTPAPAATAAPATVDVEAIMEALDAKQSHRSNWRHSIVDLMSLLGMENSLAERRELAKELGYTGDMSDTATMNVWLHKQVMRKMAENGGKVPASMMD